LSVLLGQRFNRNIGPTIFKVHVFLAANLGVVRLATRVVRIVDEPRQGCQPFLDNKGVSADGGEGQGRRAEDRTPTLTPTLACPDLAGAQTTPEKSLINGKSED